MDNVQPDRRGESRVDDSERRGRRALPRAQVVLPAVVDSLHGCRHIRLIEVSKLGARLEGTLLPGAGKDVVLRCGDVEAFGRVVWATVNRCGIQFDEEIRGRELVALRHLADSAGSSHLTDEEREALADWMNGFAR